MKGSLRGVLGCMTALCCAQPWAETLPFNFTYYGNFRHAMHSGDTRGQVVLADLPQRAGLWGLGVTAGLKGEIIQLDGKLFVSQGSDPRGAVQAPASGEEASLFVGARVVEWTEVPVPADMNSVEFEAFVARSAVAQGIALEQPFVFRIEGTFPQMRWHVVTGEALHGADGKSPPADHAVKGGHANSRTKMREFHQPGSAGQLLGIYAGTALEGIVSHPGERFHLHFVDNRQVVSGHVDAYSVGAGSVLKLPAR